MNENVRELGWQWESTLLIFTLTTVRQTTGCLAVNFLCIVRFNESSKMSQRPALSKAEMEIARIVWDLQCATVREVLESLPKGREIDYKTVQTFLRRLEAKGYLSSKRNGRSLVYTAKVRPNQVIRETVKDFVGRLFDGEALPLVEHLIREQGLENGEIDELRNMLNELEEQQSTGK